MLNIRDHTCRWFCGVSYGLSGDIAVRNCWLLRLENDRCEVPLSMGFSGLKFHLVTGRSDTFWRRWTPSQLRQKFVTQRLPGLKFGVVMSRGSQFGGCALLRSINIYWRSGQTLQELITWS